MSAPHFRPTDCGSIASGEAFGRPTVGAVAPPGNDEAGLQPGSEALIQNDPEIVAEHTGERKACATLAAQLALRGYSLHELAGGGFLISRWDRTLHCSDLGCVRAFYGRLPAG